MEAIPITFDYDGQTHRGEFSRVMGAGFNHWHLTINGYHVGQLFYTEAFGWRFGAGKGNRMEELAEFFATYIQEYMGAHPLE